MYIGIGFLRLSEMLRGHTMEAGSMLYFPDRIPEKPAAFCGVRSLPTLPPSDLQCVQSKFNQETGFPRQRFLLDIDPLIGYVGCGRQFTWGDEIAIMGR